MKGTGANGLMTERTKHAQLLTIGALARAVGVPVETLRTWERRYGTPCAERTESGHRRYSLATVERLKLVKSVIQAGHRASVALSASEAELRGLLASSPDAGPAEFAVPTQSASEINRGADDDSQHSASVARCLELIVRFDGRGLDRELSSGLAAVGALRFMERRIAPLLFEIGERWSRGELQVSHEHFASERMEEFLARHWQPLSDAATGPVGVCATPAGEHHTLGLQMAAYTLALNNVRVVYLGANLPAVDLAHAVQQHAARVALLSAARGAEADVLARECAELRASVGGELTILTGGAGFDPPPAGALGFSSLHALNDWARSFSLGHSPN